MTPFSLLLPSSSTNPAVKEITYHFEGNPTPPVKVYYFDFDGKGEDLRTALYHAQVNFIDVRINRETFESLKASGNVLAFGQLPALLTSDGEHILVQSHAILRYITTLSEIGSTMYPRDDPIEAAYIDALMDFQFDALTGLTVSSYPERAGFDCLLESAPESITAIRKALNEMVLPTHLTSLRRAFRHVGDDGPWLMGRTMPSIADFCWFHRFKLLGGATIEGIDQDIVIRDYDLKAMMKAFDALPSIQEYREKRDAALSISK